MTFQWWRTVVRSRTLFWCVVAMMLATMAGVQYVTAGQESQTYDESRQLLSGYSYLASGHFQVGLEHPPLLKLLWAIPVSWLHPDPPTAGEPYQAGHDFLYRNHVSADAMLRNGRCSAILITVLLGLAIALWTRRHFGAAAALLALWFYALDPNFLANGRYMKNDVGAALMIFVATMAWGAWLRSPTLRRLCVSGLMLGLALCSKSSALILLPVMPVLYVVRNWQQRRDGLDRDLVRALAVVGCIAYLVILIVYRFDVEPLGRFGIPVPAAAYFRGLQDLGLRQMGNALGEGFLMGEQSESGWWYLSPVSFALKTPVATLLLFAAAALLAIHRLRRTASTTPELRWFLLSVPAISYFAVSLIAHSNAGERHLLPIYPFAFVFAAAVIARTQSSWRWAAAVPAALLLVETVSIHPHYLAFFNAFAGGPVQGRHYLVNSNLDWGQDLKNLKHYIEGRNIPEVCLSYFGLADADYYGIRHRPVPELPEVNTADRVDCVVAVSATHLAIYPDQFEVLEQLQPAARIGYSIYVYDLRRSPPHAGQ